MKNNDANNKPGLILVLAAIFLVGGIATVVVYAIGTISEIYVLLIGILLALVGTFFVVYGILRVKTIHGIKSLKNDPNAIDTTAKFIGSKVSSFSSKSSSVGIGNVTIPTNVSVNVFKKVIYEYTDEAGVVHTVKSSKSFFPKQIDYLKEKGTFAIRCKGKVSDITEELPEGNKHFNIQ